jgi:hypothetical protein
MNKLSITSINNRAPLQVTTRNGAFEFFADSNPSYVEVLTAFNDFIKEFPGKLE